MNLYQKLVELQKCAASFEKDSKGYGYTYVSGAQVLNAIKKKKDELGLLLVPAVQNPQEVSKHEYKNEKGREKVDFVVRGEMAYKWINAEKPEEALVVPWQYFGQQDDISKAFGSALTYSERYFLLKFLGVPTDEDDPDTKGVERERRYKTPAAESSPIVVREERREASTPAPAAKGASNYIQVKNLLARYTDQDFDSVCEFAKAQFKTDRLNDLAPADFKKVVAFIKGTLPEKDEDLPFVDNTKKIETLSGGDLLPWETPEYLAQKAAEKQARDNGDLPY